MQRGFTHIFYTDRSKKSIFTFQIWVAQNSKREISKASTDVCTVTICPCSFLLSATTRYKIISNYISQILQENAVNSNTKPRTA